MSVVARRLLLTVVIALALAALVWLLWPAAEQAEPSAEQEFNALVAAAAMQAVGEEASDEDVAKRSAEIPVFTGRLKTPASGDWPQIMERRVVRVVVPYSRTFFYNDNGQTRGISADLLAELERYLNKTFKTKRKPITVIAIPVNRDHLLPAVQAGIGDIAVGNLTMTDERLANVDFVPFTGMTVNELVVSSSDLPAMTSELELAGQEVAVRRSSSYHASLVALNERLKSAGKKPVTIISVPEELEDEDLLEMVDAGLLNLTVVDDWKYQLWHQVYAGITSHDALVLRRDAEIGWAIRKESPELAKVLAGFMAKAEKQGLRQLKFAEYQKRFTRLGKAAGQDEWQKVDQTLALFEKFGGQYDFDHLLLLAQGYQESRLDQKARSAAGAIGVMQLLPATGKSMQVGDIGQMENNIHAGAKYLRHLSDDYFNDPAIDATNRAFFALAGYNAGPNAINRMRRIAANQGLDPNRWFGQVEVVTGQKIGIEPVRYVRNIVKYYVAYRQMLDRQQAKAKALEQMKQ